MVTAESCNYFPKKALSQMFDGSKYASGIQFNNQFTKALWSLSMEHGYALKRQKKYSARPVY